MTGVAHLAAADAHVTITYRDQRTRCQSGPGASTTPLPVLGTTYLVERRVLQARPARRRMVAPVEEIRVPVELVVALQRKAW